MGPLHPLNNFRSDIPASIVVFLVALPLCLGIALASGAPLFSGIIAGFVGGIAVGFYSKSALSISGPAAGLTTIVLASIHQLGDYKFFLVAVVLAGVLQVVLGYLRAGTIGNYFPSSVIKGMLAAIGLILILKQIPHAVGYDADYIGDEDFLQQDGRNTFSELIYSLNVIQPGAAIICLLSIGILILWEKPFIRNTRFAKVIPAPLLVVFLGVALNELFNVAIPGFHVTSGHLVSLPVSENLASFFNQFTYPDFSALFNQNVWVAAVTIAVVASLETLLSIDAIDKLDPYKRLTPLNHELKAQGVGNMLSGLMGGLPITSVIVRSSANVNSGGKTKTSAMVHGLLLLMTVIAIPGQLNKIPLACLAAILLMTGYKLTKPSLIVTMFKKGWGQFIPFAITIVAILLTNLLQGIFIGLTIGLIFVLRTNFHKALFCVREGNRYLVRLTKDVSFLNKALLRNTLREIPNNSHVIIDGVRSTFIDHDILETIQEFQQSALSRNISVELNQSVTAANPFFKA
ncbi:MAG: SulP family inorganic anion transporter [Cyclobacteriaceae bacterium]|nr:SulP family inorganic anion transporter [Cyclobacteriaceae bacterium]UYN85195.1 MAG: SulP family inorganic anion transporter [Cyclobacteriaceae bacterium]